MVPRLSFLMLSVVICVCAHSLMSQGRDEELAVEFAESKSPSGQWTQFCGSSRRNNVAEGKPPIHWDVKSGKNIRWAVATGTQVNSSPVISGGKVFLCANNGSGYIARYPSSIDLGCLLCFEQATGKFLWQYSVERLSQGRVHDWPAQGMFSVSHVDGERLWIVNNRCVVACLDTNGFRDGKNNGPVTREASQDATEADIIWEFDMFNQLGVRPHNVTACSVTSAGDVLLVNTGNGVNEGHVELAAPNAPSFIALDRNTGRLLWTDRSPGLNILHGQWSSPAYAVIDGTPQAIFPGGDGWLYSFDIRDLKKGRSNLLWSFDCNPKKSEWVLGGRGGRNNIIAVPCVTGTECTSSPAKTPNTARAPRMYGALTRQSGGTSAPTRFSISATRRRPSRANGFRLAKSRKGTLFVRIRIRASSGCLKPSTSTRTARSNSKNRSIAQSLLR